MNEYREKLLSIAAPRKIGAVERKVERTPKSTVIHDVHWDGRVDATVRPETARLKATLHNEGRKKGEVAEVRPMTPKEKESKYGPS